MMGRTAKRHTLDGPLRKVSPAPHWKKLRQGDRVRVELAPGFETGGVVDAVTANHEAVWVYLDDGAGRTLLHCSDSVDIRPGGA